MLKKGLSLQTLTLKNKRDRIKQVKKGDREKEMEKRGQGKRDREIERKKQRKGGMEREIETRR